MTASHGSTPPVEERSRPDLLARRLFAPLGCGYERWARLLSLGQDRRWRRAMVEGLEPPPGGAALDVAAGTGSITRLLDERGVRVVAVDQSREMLRHAGPIRAVVATAERLPFPDGAFEVVTFGYLLRYVADLDACLGELARVLRPGGSMGMVEFGRPGGMWRLPWRVYTRLLLPLAGRLIGDGWGEVGGFLGPSIDRFHDRFAAAELAERWESAGLVEVRWRSMSLGGGLIMWGRKR